MPIPQFITDLRAKAGNHQLWLVTSNAIVFSNHREIHNIEVLLAFHHFHQAWVVPGGICDPGEHPSDCARRECYEETSVRCYPYRLAAITVSPVITYDNGDIAQYTELWYHCRYLGGIAAIADDESYHVGWRKLNDLPDNLAPNQRTAIEAAARGDQLVLSDHTMASRIPWDPGNLTPRDPDRS